MKLLLLLLLLLQTFNVAGAVSLVVAGGLVVNLIQVPTHLWGVFQDIFRTFSCAAADSTNCRSKSLGKVPGCVGNCSVPTCRRTPNWWPCISTRRPAAHRALRDHPTVARCGGTQCANLAESPPTARKHYVSPSNSTDWHAKPPTIRPRCSHMSHQHLLP